MSFNRFSNLSLINMPDCVALSDLKKCRRLTTLVCDKNMCPFKQNFDEETESLQNAYDRISHLDDNAQTRIAKKYYNGNMPWKKIEQLS
ncbi:MAG: hypothetical protein AB7V48_06230 [Sedimentibacter sp.]